MEMNILQNKDMFPSFVAAKLAGIQIDYKEKYKQIKDSERTAFPSLAAGVVLLLNYRELHNGKSEYVFQLIKRSATVSQAGDISCPGGILHPDDKIVSNSIAAEAVTSFYKRAAGRTIHKDKETIELIRIFLANALREAWEEIGLNPAVFSFLGALPCYSLSLIARTIFPLVCLIPEPYEFNLSSEVEKVLEVPVSTFFDGSHYALLEVVTSFEDTTTVHNSLFPCILLQDGGGKKEVLWGATFNIITNFLRILSGNNLPAPSSPQRIRKILSATYISGNSQ